MLSTLEKAPPALIDVLCLLKKIDSTRYPWSVRPRYLWTVGHRDQKKDGSVRWHYENRRFEDIHCPPILWFYLPKRISAQVLQGEMGITLGMRGKQP